jgi:hypothetical protein
LLLSRQLVKFIFASENKIMKQTILTNWSFIRFLRLGMGIAILVQAVVAKDILFALLGVVFTAMPVFNIGCCGTQGCYASSIKNQDKKKDVTYEEVV